MYHYAKRQPYNTKYDLDNMFWSDLALLKGLPHNSATGKHRNMGMETEWKREQEWEGMPTMEVKILD